jgi:DNA-directed RNA polymerase subunit RPC12/RpoP
MNQAVEYKCPACSAPLHIENRFTKTVVCPYCTQTSFVSTGGLQATGRDAQLAEFPSILAVGATGQISGSAFKVLGRVRYSYDDGFWDEWLVQRGLSDLLWLQEDEGEFTLFEKQAITTPVPPFEAIKVGANISVNNLSVFITEKNEAVVAGGEGELNFRFKTGEGLYYADGNCSGRVVSIEFSPDEIYLSTGDALPQQAIKLNN